MDAPPPCRPPVAAGAPPAAHERILAAPGYPRFADLLRDSGCRRCPLGAARRNIVVDRGNPRAGIMAIGEAPGEQEDLAGRAFVGRAGRVLDGLLRDAGLDPDADLLIANVVKCRPPGNRVPRPAEAAACLPYLDAQIALVRPHTILLLGATALRHFAVPAPRPGAMGQVAGRPVTVATRPGIAFYALYHPAYLLRSPGKRPIALRHLEHVREHLRRAGRWPGTVARPQRGVVYLPNDQTRKETRP